MNYCPSLSPVTSWHEILICCIAFSNFSFVYLHAVYKAFLPLLQFSSKLVTIAKICSCLNLDVIKLVFSLCVMRAEGKLCGFLSGMASVLQIILLFHDLMVRRFKWRYLCSVHFVNVHFLVKPAGLLLI